MNLQTEKEKHKGNLTEKKCKDARCITNLDWKQFRTLHVKGKHIACKHFQTLAVGGNKFWHWHYYSIKDW